MDDQELPVGVRRVPAPAVQWHFQTMRGHFDGYVFEDDPSDLAKFMRWMASKEYNSMGTVQLTITKTTW